MRWMIIAFGLVYCLSVKAEIITTIWITKYALTRGIEKKEAEILKDGDMAKVGDDYYRGIDFQFNPSDAILRAREMQNQKLASLQRQEERIKSLNFTEENIK